MNRVHCPFQSGYVAPSAACAPPIDIDIAVSAIAPIKLRYGIAVLPSARVKLLNQVLPCTRDVRRPLVTNRQYPRSAHEMIGLQARPHGGYQIIYHSTDCSTSATHSISQ